MSDVTIFGKGNMGTAIAGVLGKGGATVTHIGSDDTAAAVTEVLSAYEGQLDGLVLVDLTNPLDFSTFDSLVVPAGSSAAAEIAATVPGARVLKAFNTNFAATLAAKNVAGITTTVLIAGDDADAKSALAGVIEAGGLKAVDAGSLKRAHELEALGFLQLTLAAGNKTAWTSGFALAD
jgi:hypothetical protein